MISEEEKRISAAALQTALECGAIKARVTLNKSVENIVATLDGEIDRVTRCEDRSLELALFVDGRFGSFSTNRLGDDAIRDFITKAVRLTRLMAEDAHRDLPAPDRICRNAGTGFETGIYDGSISGVTAESRLKAALDASVTGKIRDDGYTVISEEGEWSDSEYCTYITDTQGLNCMHCETVFDYGVEVTVQDKDGGKYSGYWWESKPFLKDLDLSGCGAEAVRRAAAQIGSKPSRNGRYNLVVDTEVASKMVSPVLRALNGYAIQQNDSFLMDSLGRQVFPEGLTVKDVPHIKGQTGSKLFDSEGVATREVTVIENGIVKEYFLNTYMASKLDMQPTQEEATRPKVLPWPEPGLTRDDLMKKCGGGILVTDFNGGNSNSATGDFSYGIEGFLFRNGKIVRPVSGMLVTGNFLSLWNSLVAIADDARPCLSKIVPTLAFSNLEFNG